MSLLKLGPVNFCLKTAAVWQFIGYAFFALKILVPLVIIILGVIDFSKAVVSFKNDEMNVAVKQLSIKLITGVVIFFIPTIVNMVFYFIENEALKESSACRVCLLEPFGNDCKTKKNAAKNQRKVITYNVDELDKNLSI